MNITCTVEYLDDADVLGITEEAHVPGPVAAVLMLSESRPAKGTILRFSTELGRPDQFDLLENAEVTENADGSLRISCDSMRAEGAFGVGKSRVALKVTPTAGYEGDL